MHRVDLINYLIREKRYSSYLEIGCDRNATFNAVVARHKVGVDPKRGGTLRITSDEFFCINRERFDLVFIDGLHLKEQVIQDVRNALRCLKPGGCVVLHDCLPKARVHQERQRTTSVRAWTGDVWKAVVYLRQQPDCDIAVLDSDWGLGVLFARPNSDLLREAPPLTWERYKTERDRLLRTIDDEVMKVFIADNGRIGRRTASD